MTYRGALAFRWSRRDWLAVLIVAMTVTFLVGVVLLVTAMGAQTAAIAGDHESPGAATYYDTRLPADETADEAVVIPVARVNVGGTTAFVAGVDDDDRNRVYGDRALAPSGSDVERDGTVGASATLGDAFEMRTEELVGDDGTVEVTVTQGGAGVLPPSWYVTNPAVVEDLGQTGTLVVADEGDVPLRGILTFFQEGTDEVISTIIASSAGIGVLLVVTVFSVTRMTVRDRRSTIQVARATGATPRAVATLFVARATLLSSVGVALGFALGVIVTNATVNAAVAVGIPATLSIDVGSAVTVIAPLLGGMVLVGALAGALAVRSTVRRPPAAIGRERHGGRSGWLAPRLLDARVVVPAAATLAVFVAFAALIAGLGLTVAPLATADGATVTEPGSPHLAASSVPAAHADALREQGIDASAEILLFAVADGRPVVARGAEFDAFATVSDARLVEGRAPETANEAVVGASLAGTLELEVGDAVQLSGSTEPGVARVDVVGVYDAPGAVADQLVVPLAIARHLDGTREGRVQFVRTRGLPADGVPKDETAGNDDSVDAGTADGVIDIVAPETVGAGESIEVVVTFRNDGLVEKAMATEVTYRGETIGVETTVPGESEAKEQLTFEAGEPGVGTFEAAGLKRSVEVLGPDSLSIRGLPDRVPPGSEPLARVLDGTGDPVGGATVAVDGEAIADDGEPRTTDADGYVRVPFDAEGDATVTVRDNDRSAEETVVVTTDAEHGLEIDLVVVPSSPTPITEPTFELTLSNPWTEPLERQFEIDAPGGPYERAVTVDPGKETTLKVGLPRRSSGSYDVVVTEAEGNEPAGEPVAETSYTVRGDDRIASALATAGYEQGTPLSQAAEVAFGNLRLLLGALGALAGLMTVGGTTAALASAVQARRRTIGIKRATGASPWLVLRIVLGDAVRIGALATAVALVAGLAALAGLSTVGYLTAFGVRLSVVPPWRVLVGIVVGIGAVLLLSATLATAALLARSPAALLSDREGGIDG